MVAEDLDNVPILNAWRVKSFALTTRIVTFIIFQLCAVVGANPLPLAMPAEDRVYMASEHLAVNISPNGAELKGTFTFSNQPAVSQATSIILELPLWFPEINPNDPSVAGFWKRFKKDQNIEEVNSETKATFEKAVSLRVVLGDKPLAVEQFSSLTSTNSRQRWAPREWQQESGFCCLVFTFYFENAYLLTQKPLTVSYRQPLLKVNGVGEFFYLPVLQNVPTGLSTADTNRYTITIIAEPDCSLVVSNGVQKALLKAGHRITLNPKHYQPIRVFVTMRAGAISPLN